MIIIDCIKTKNYRGIKELFFMPNSINVIVGPNNIGKSAILEAIGLLLSSQNKFEDSLGNNIFDYLFRIKEYSPTYLIHLHENISEIKANIMGMDYRITIEYYPEKIPRDERLHLITEYFENYVNDIIDETYIKKKELISEILTIILSEMKKIMNMEKSEIETLENKIKNRLSKKYSFIGKYRKLEEIRVIDEFEELRNDILSQVYRSPKLIITAYMKNDLSGLYLFLKNPIKIETKPFFGLFTEDWGEKHEIVPFVNGLKEIPLIFNFQKSTFASSIEKLYDLVVKKGKIDRAVELLKERNIIENIRKTDDGMMVFTKHHEKPLPLSSMGEGFLSLLKLIFLVAIAKKGIILLEEPEVSLHPSYLNFIAEELVLNSGKSQFFISTHSLDLLSLLLEKAEEYQKLDEINVIRLHYIDATKQVHPEVLEGVKAKEEVDEIGTDLRLT